MKGEIQEVEAVPFPLQTKTDKTDLAELFLIFVEDRSIFILFFMQNYTNKIRQLTARKSRKFCQLAFEK